MVKISHRLWPIATPDIEEVVQKNANFFLNFVRPAALWTLILTHTKKFLENRIFVTAETTVTEKRQYFVPSFGNLAKNSIIIWCETVFWM